MAITYDEDGSQSRTITERKRLLAMMNEGDVRGGATDAQIYQAYKELTDPKHPNTLEKLLKKLKKGKV